MKCAHCEMLVINGIPTHETGCPRAWETEKECPWCGSAFQPESRFQVYCSVECAESDAGTAPIDEENWQVVL